MFSTYATRAPRCLFDLPVRKLTWNSQKLEFKTLEDEWELGSCRLFGPLEGWIVLVGPHKEVGERALGGVALDDNSKEN